MKAVSSPLPFSETASDHESLFPEVQPFSPIIAMQRDCQCLSDRGRRGSQHSHCTRQEKTPLNKSANLSGRRGLGLGNVRPEF